MPRSREGYVCNAIVHRAVCLIAESMGALNFVLYEGAAEHSAHPLLDLIKRPNPRQDGASLLEAVSSHLLLAGNAYLEAVGIEGQGNDQAKSNVRELYALRPDRMRVVPGPDGWPQAYEYTVAGATVRFEQSAALPPILQLTLFNPLDDYYGLSPLEAAAVAVDTHNAAAKWNKALLDNAARPSGALVYDGPEGAVMSDAQFERLKKELADQYQGTANAGRPLLLEGGLDWKAMSLSPKDMDFMEAKHSAAREIALAFGVPPMLLAIHAGRSCQRRSPSEPCATFSSARRARHRAAMCSRGASMRWLGNSSKSSRRWCARGPNCCRAARAPNTTSTRAI